MEGTFADVAERLEVCERLEVFLSVSFVTGLCSESARSLLRNDGGRAEGGRYDACPLVGALRSDNCAWDVDPNDASSAGVKAGGRG